VATPAADASPRRNDRLLEFITLSQTKAPLKTLR
jgi:hypothetical protein